MYVAKLIGKGLLFLAVGLFFIATFTLVGVLVQMVTTFLSGLALTEILRASEEMRLAAGFTAFLGPFVGLPARCLFAALVAGASMFTGKGSRSMLWGIISLNAGVSVIFSLHTVGLLSFTL